MEEFDQSMDKYVRIGVNRYKVDILVNNWNEERFDSNYIKQLKPALNVNFKALISFEIKNLSKWLFSDKLN